ncbi:DUF2752 domain-containing protein [Kineothrix sp. MB12-C1]|uniref:DUF2752 domain-containing protein n=1 Tax=Kineothrix sp. MB12-C1 TaxID=3070215 RepID=UPI0027D209DF|nr:DUF2752 domain-containing protein [Kineothrix sp. MB12-C1]WMC93833.1 DUF2752 domain-containing protein [Kineothrix sp. MB12-C1]
MKNRLEDIGRRIASDLWDYKVVILIFLAYYIFMHVVFHAFCPLVLTTGFPCAGCGMTRAIFFLLTGQFARSFRLSPMAFPVLSFLLYCGVYRYVLGRKIKGFYIGMIVLVAALLIVYVYRMYTIFPNRPPYVYTRGNFLESHIPYYREFLRRLLGI